MCIAMAYFIFHLNVVFIDKNNSFKFLNRENGMLSQLPGKKSGVFISQYLHLPLISLRIDFVLFNP